MSKVVEIITEKDEKDVNFLSDVDIKFVSLVKYGANRVPFRVVKSESKGGDADLMIVQSILVPKDQSLDCVATKKGLEWVADASKECQEEYEEYTKYVQMPIEKLDRDSVGMVKLDDEGVWAIVGKTEKEVDDQNALTLGKREVEKYMNVPVPTGNKPVAEVVPNPIPITFNEMFEKELYNLLEVVKGTLSQVGAKPTQVRKTVLGAVDAFRSFLVMGLDATNGNQSKNKADTEFNKLEDKISKISDAIKKSLEGGDKKMGLFKDDKEKKEFENAVLEIMNKQEAAEVAKKEEEDAKKAKVENKDAENVEKNDKPKEDKFDALIEKVTGLTNDVKSVMEKQDKFENQLNTDPTTEGDPPVEVEKKDKEVSVFKGILSKKA